MPIGLTLSVKAMSYLAKYVPDDLIPSSQRKVFYSLCNRTDPRGG